MRQFVKLINGSPIFVDENPVFGHGAEQVQILGIKNKPEILAKYGYKELIDTGRPEPTSFNGHYNTYYEEEENLVNIKYTWIEAPPPPPVLPQLSKLKILEWFEDNGLIVEFDEFMLANKEFARRYNTASFIDLSYNCGEYTVKDLVLSLVKTQEKFDSLISYAREN